MRVKKMFFAVVAACLLLNLWVYRSGRALLRTPDQACKADAILVLGAFVFQDGAPCAILEDRLSVAFDLYKRGLAPKLLLSGDHGRKDYDEVNAMRAFLEEKGVPPQDIFLDHAGFDTYNSMYRARDVFKAHRLLVVTQRFHLIRALYLAQGLGLEAEGVASDLREYQGMGRLQIREMGARLKAFYEVNRGTAPVFLGDAIPLEGDARATHDRLQRPQG